MLSYDWKATCIRTPMTQHDHEAIIAMRAWILHGVKIFGILEFTRRHLGCILEGRITKLRIYDHALSDKAMSA